MHPNTQVIIDLAWEMNANKDHPAALIGAWHSSDYCTDTEGPVPIPLAPVLETSLQTIAPLRSKVNGNYIGCCCEVRSSNQILEPKRYLSITDISFTPAIRPRTMQIVPRCRNCVTVFGP
jgi:hypothetical protein